jgi:hypothetical protein
MLRDTGLNLRVFLTSSAGELPSPRLVVKMTLRYWLPAHQKAADLAMEHTDFEHHF